VCGSLSQFLFLKPTVYACSWGPLPARTGDLTISYQLHRINTNKVQSFVQNRTLLSVSDVRIKSPESRQKWYSWELLWRINRKVAYPVTRTRLWRVCARASDYEEHHDAVWEGICRSYVRVIINTGEAVRTDSCMRMPVDY